MITVQIKGDDWCVAATAHEERFDNPFDRRNQDVLVAYAIEDALGLASRCLWNPFYVLAKAVVNLERRDGGGRLLEAEAAFIEAAEEYCRVAEQITKQKEPQHG